MFNKTQLREIIIRPSLELLGLWSKSAEELMILTCAHESLGGTYIKQVNGPALGIMQMEEATYNDLWTSYLPSRTDLVYKIMNFMQMQYKPKFETVQHNISFAVMMARIRYLPAPEKLPDYEDIKALAIYWDKYYNRNPNKGFPEEAVYSYNKFMGIKNTKKTAL